MNQDKYKYILKFNDAGAFLSENDSSSTLILDIDIKNLGEIFDSTARNLVLAIKKRVAEGVKFYNFTSYNYSSGLVQDFILFMAGHDLYIGEDNIICLNANITEQASNSLLVDKLLNDGYTIKKVEGKIVVVE